MDIIKKTTRIPLPDDKKIIEELIGRVNTDNHDISIARMTAKSGWTEPGQTPDFDEYTIVLSGIVSVETREGTYEAKAGETIFAPKGEWIRYSTPVTVGAEYISICKPAFSPEIVHRDE